MEGLPVIHQKRRRSSTPVEIHSRFCEGCRMDRFSPVIRIGAGKANESCARRKPMQFALMIYHTPEEFAMRKNDYSDPHLGAWRAYYKALVEAGVSLGAGA